MRKLKIMEHISLDGVIQSSGEDDFPYSDWTVPYRNPCWPGGDHRRAWRKLRSAAWPSYIRHVVGLLAKGAEQPNGGRPQCGNKICRYPPSGKP
jgi:hypothetical protein